jgi:Secretion system C-terminal sorting domain
MPNFFIRISSFVSWNLMISIFLLAPGLEDAKGQAFGYQMDKSSLIIRNNDTLDLPWGRGLNNPQLQNIDLNNDNIEDLLIYDRSGYDFQTFINQGGKWHYDPRFESTLPHLIDGWMVVADADCDGVQDLFTYAPAGVRVYKNFPDTAFSYWPVFETTIYFLDSFGWNNLLISQGDYPSILDIDGDGDTDILSFEWLNGGYVQYYRNMAMEINGHCDSLIYQMEDYCWGRFYECQTCGKYDIDLDGNCLVQGTTQYCQNKSIHAGSTTLHLDLNGDSLYDILLGDIGCKPIVSMRNKGSASFAKMDSARQGFPQYDIPATDYFYPVMFNVDVDFDGRKDLIVTANTSGNPANSYRLDQSATYYKDISLVDSPDFAFQKNNFLQDEMYDVGEYSHPALVDYDGDGDLDLFVGNRGRRIAGNFFSNIFYLENTGSSGKPEFTETDSDFLSLASLGLQNIRPFFNDLTGDGIEDLVFVALDNQGINSVFHYFENLGSPGGQMIFNSNNLLSYPGMDTIVFRNDMPHFIDISGDGTDDLLVGRDVFGNVSYYRNTGSIQMPDFVLENYRIGNIGNFWGDQGTNVQVFDFNQDGNLDMAYGSNDGLLKIYSDFIPNMFDTLSPYSNLVYNSLMDSMVGDMLGSSIHLAPGDLNGDGDLDFILGSHTGGIQFIRFDTSLVSGLDLPFEISRSFGIKIWPNPSHGELHFDYPGHWTMVQILDLRGRHISSYGRAEIQNSTLYLSGLPKGVYILKVFGNEATGTARIIISGH